MRASKSSLPPLEKEKTALLIVDMQNDYCKPDGFFARNRHKDVTPILRTIPTLSSFLRALRKINVFRIYVKTIHFDYTNSPTWLSKKDKGQRHCLPNTWGSEVVDELKPLEGEPIVTKHRYSAFINTNLDLILRSKGIANLLLTGTATNVCVESTARDAFMHDYLTVIVEDCVSTGDPDLHEASLVNLSKYFGYVATSNEILGAFG